MRPLLLFLLAVLGTAHAVAGERSRGSRVGAQRHGWRAAGGAGGKGGGRAVAVAEHCAGLSVAKPRRFKGGLVSGSWLDGTTHATLPHPLPTASDRQVA